MYNNIKENRTIILYNFLGEFVSSLEKFDLQEAIEDMGLNKALENINVYASKKNFTVDEIIHSIYRDLSKVIDNYTKEYIEYEDELFPVLEDVIVVNIKDYDMNGNRQFDVYSRDGKNISTATRLNVNHALQNLEDNVVNMNLIVIVVDVISYGNPIMQIII